MLNESDYNCGDDMPEDLGALLKDYVFHDKEYRELESKLAAAKKRLDAMEGPLSEQMGLMGMQSARVDGMTIYIKRTQYVSKGAGIETETVCEALREVGLDYMVKEGYNANSLKSKVKEYQEQAGGVPPVLERLLSIGERISVETRRV